MSLCRKVSPATLMNMAIDDNVDARNLPTVEGISEGLTGGERHIVMRDPERPPRVAEFGTIEAWRKRLSPARSADGDLHAVDRSGPGSPVE